MKLASPKDASITRPTSAKAREAILHKISEEIQHSVFIDLFSGTGAVGLEAISRGAEGALFIENHRGTLKTLEKNVELARERMTKQGLSPNPFKILTLDATKALQQISRKGDKDNCSYVIWADPPYANCLSWLETINQQKPEILSRTKLFIVEADHSLLQESSFKLSNWSKLFEKKYGKTAIVAWSKADQKENS